MKHPTISACLVVWNGEKQIRSCLESIKKVVDEIVVVHDGPCSDKTLAICKEYTVNVFVLPYVGEAEPHRQFTFDKATSEWILWIDQDEQLSIELQKNIRSLATNENVAGYTFRWPVKYGTQNLTKGFFSRVQKLVLFRKKALNNFQGLPNEAVRVKGKVADTQFVLLHDQNGERDTLRVFFTKTLRIVQIHAEQLVSKGLASKPAVFYLFKAPIWFVLYLGYYYVIKGAFRTKADLSISLQLALYNFYLYWYVFVRKMK